MIIVRSPLRITFGGGGTDLPSFYKTHGGFTVGAAIDKYVYISMHPAFRKEIIIRYSKTESVDLIDDIQHPLFRECLRLVPPYNDRFEITSMADVPAGTGLGSSGAFACALLKALHVYNNEHIPTKELAEEACKVEIEILKEPVGKQDQYCSAFGGLNSYEFLQNGEVVVNKLKIENHFRNRLEDNLHLFFTGETREASKILSEQKMETEKGDELMLDNLQAAKIYGKSSAEAISCGRLTRFADLINRQWDLKMKRSALSTPDEIVRQREHILEQGAHGCKLIGAGGGGFLMAYWPDPIVGINELRFRFDYEGTKVLTCW